MNSSEEVRLFSHHRVYIFYSWKKEMKSSFPF